MAVLVLVACLAAVVAVTVSSTHRHRAAAAALTPVQQWLQAPLALIAHRGGSADWPEGSPLAYRKAAAWSPSLALEFPARRTADGVWVASDDATTGRVYGRDLTIADSTWAQLSALRSRDGGQPMARLEQDVLEVVPRTRVLVVDDKDDLHVDALLGLLGRYGGPGRTVVKSYYANRNTPPEARRLGYLTWGYYYARTMADFAATQGRFDFLALQYNAPAADWATLRATGKRLFAHIVATPAQARQGTANGATGLMVSGVTEVVPQGS